MFLELVYVFFAGIFLTGVLIYAGFCWWRRHCRRVRDLTRKLCGPSIGFFHPYCNTGGGGERVLWCAIRSLQNRFQDLKVVVYTGDIDSSPKEIMRRVQQRLDITLPREVDFVYLHNRSWVEAEHYPYFTLLGQSLGSIVLGVEAMMSFLPDVYIDTMGYAFTFPLFKSIAGCHVACYVHYPTITRDMLRRVSGRVAAHNNRDYVANSPFLSFTKLVYYRIFAWLYCKAGRFSDIVLVNSSWTEDHINSLWDRPLTTHRVYPPCDTAAFKDLDAGNKKKRQNEGDETGTEAGSGDDPAGDGKRADDANKPRKDDNEIRIVSVGQFRPEKDHPLQLKAMYQLRQILTEEIWERTRLVFVGSCRNADDEIRVQDMKDLCKHLSLENNVDFKVNISFDELKCELARGTIGLHAMWNEHFGIGVVECMAAGLIMVAHRSGGPKMDIIEEAENSRNGYLAADESEYAAAIASVIRLPESQRRNIREAARSSVERFSVKEFENGFVRSIEPFFYL